MNDKLQEIVVILARIESDLAHHIKRTELLEEEVRGWKSSMLKVTAHIALVQGLGKVLIGLAAVGATLAAFLSIK